MSQMTAFDNRLDQLISLDLGGRGVEQLFASAREQIGQPLVGAAADALLALKPGDNVIRRPARFHAPGSPRPLVRMTVPPGWPRSCARWCSPAMLPVLC